MRDNIVQYHFLFTYQIKQMIDIIQHRSLTLFNCQTLIEYPMQGEIVVRTAINAQYRNCTASSHRLKAELQNFHTPFFNIDGRLHFVEKIALRSKTHRIETYICPTPLLH